MTNSSLAKFIVTAILLALLYGFLVGAFIFREPDTCFLLSLGRWICEHKALPTIDPFSYTFSIYSQPLGLVAYQWLTEVIFFTIYKLGGHIGLETFGCSILICSFFIIPWQILNCFSVGPLRAGIIVMWLTCGTIDRMLLKPEIFSYLFLSLFILTIVKAEKQIQSHSINWKQIGILGILMLIWANLHTGFVIGIVLTLLLAFRDLFFWLFDKFSKQNSSSSYSPFWLIAFIVCSSASFITPYGIVLWKYIPHLYFHPVNRHIIELKPLTFTMLMHNFPLLISFFGLSALVSLQVVRKLRTKLTKSDIFFILIAIIGIVLGIICMRMVTFALLLMLPVIGSGFSVKTVSNPLGIFGGIRLFAIVLFFALSGCLAMCLLSNPTIPISTKAFAAPFCAIKYMATHKINGNLLNDPEFGDTIMWNMDKPPLLFIDTRFDAYPAKITEDYLTLRDCNLGWKELLQKYHITWIFMQPSAKLCIELGKDKQWQTVYKDAIAQIIVHR